MQSMTVQKSVLSSELHFLVIVIVIALDCWFCCSATLKLNLRNGNWC